MFPFFPDHQLNWQGHFRKVLVGCTTRKFNLSLEVSLFPYYNFVSLAHLYFPPFVSFLSLLPINTSAHTGNKEEIKIPGSLHSFPQKYYNLKWNNEETQPEEYPCHLKTCFDPKNHRLSPHPAPAKQHSTTKINTVAQSCVGSEAATGSGIKGRDSWQPREGGNLPCSNTDVSGTQNINVGFILTSCKHLWCKH